MKSLATPCMLLAGLAVAVYLNTLPAQFTFDDNFAVITNGDVADATKPLLALFKNDFWGQDISSEQSHKSYRPFTVLSFRLQRIVGQYFFGAQRARLVEQQVREGKHDNSRGIDPFIFHLSNVAAHAAVTVLVFRLGLRLIASRHQQFVARPVLSSQDLAEAFVAALLFAVHPVHTEAVSGIVGHAELLCALLSIPALLSYMAAADGRVGNMSSHWRHIALAILLGWAAALTKEIGITIMGAMACYDLLLAPMYIHFSPANAVPPPSSKPNRGKASAGAAAAAWAAGSKSRQQHGLGLKLLRLLATAVGVVVYVKVRSLLAGDQLVRIYRKVENPIPFSQSSLERKLTTGYLHSRYFGLLLAPVQLSADWSYACIDYVSSLHDPRNLATLSLYLFILTVLLAAAPWRVLAQWAGLLKAETPAGEQARRWRLMVLTGLMVAPYFPASNVLFYVGTFIGERLMYFPSVGFCLLVAEYIAPPLLPLAERLSEEGLKGVLGKRAKPLGRKVTTAVLLLGLVVSLFSLKTLHRNTEWYDEERLFRAAEKVCGNSAKVQLNCGILERRYQNWDKSVAHFKKAKEVDPTYCEPNYQIGVTMLNTGKDFQTALDYVELGVACKYTAAEAVQALNKVFAALLEEPGSSATAIGMRWSKILARPEIKRYSEAVHYCEQTAMLPAKSGYEDFTKSALDSCRAILDKAEPDAVGRTAEFPIRVAAPPELLDTLKACFEARAEVILAAARVPGHEEHRFNSTQVKQAAYHYFTKSGKACRGPMIVTDVEPGSGEHAQRAASYHMELVHAVQKADPSDPWVQIEWAETMLAQNRSQDALLHCQVAGQLLKGALQNLLDGKQIAHMGQDGKPLSVNGASEGAIAAYKRGAEAGRLPGALKALGEQGQKIRIDCFMQVEICTVYNMLQSAPPTAGIPAAEMEQYQAALSACLQEAQRMGCPMDGQAAPLEAREEGQQGAQRADWQDEEEKGHEGGPRHGGEL